MTVALWVLIELLWYGGSVVGVDDGAQVRAVVTGCVVSG